MEEIKGVVIKRPTTPSDREKAHAILNELKVDVDLATELAIRGLLTQQRLDRKNQIWKASLDEVPNLMGFDNFEDAQYYIINFTEFKNFGGNQNV